jgi:heme/copper-type cytochrome/quinol oxidase subunit 1
MFNWLCTYLLTYTRLMNTCCIMYIKMFLIMFTVGGSSGLILGNNVIDISLHDSYYVVCHFHIVLSLGSILSLLIGYIYYSCYVLMCCVCILSNVLCLYHMLYVFVGILVTFIPVHLLCYCVLPRRILEYTDCVNCWNSISSVGSSVT